MMTFKEFVQSESFSPPDRDQLLALTKLNRQVDLLIKQNRATELPNKIVVVNRSNLSELGYSGRSDAMSLFFREEEIYIPDPVTGEIEQSGSNPAYPAGSVVINRPKLQHMANQYGPKGAAQTLGQVGRWMWNRMATSQGPGLTPHTSVRGY